MRIALDAMGGDHAPAATVEGALLHAHSSNDTVVLVGDEPRLRDELARLKLPSRRALGRGQVEIRHAPDVIGMGEHPGQAVRRKPDSSLRVCFDLVKAGDAAAVVSAGNSGAVMAAALLVLGRLPGVERPALVAVLPTLDGRLAALLDCGANVSCRPAQLVQFGFLGEVWARRVLGVRRPRVALLSNGSEPTKGTELTRAVLATLQRSELDFTGYVEGNELFSGKADVIVTDGFTGNVTLKTTEGAAATLGAMLKREVEARSTARLGKLLVAPAFAAFKKILDWAEYGGAPLLGVDGVAIIAHGRSSPRAIKNALRAASVAGSLDLSQELVRAAAAAKALCGPGGAKAIHAEG